MSHHKEWRFLRVSDDTVTRWEEAGAATSETEEAPAVSRRRNRRFQREQIGIKKCHGDESVSRFRRAARAGITADRRFLIL